MTDDYLGLLLAESCILFLNWYQLGEILCFKGLRGGWFPRKRDKDFILKLLVRWETRINSAQKLNRRNSTNHQNRYAPIIFYRSTSASITRGRSHFSHCTIWVDNRVNRTTQSRKARHCNCYQKNTWSALVGPPNAWNGYYPGRCWKNRSC